MATILVGDIGGTHARFALVKAQNPALTHIERLRCVDHISLEAALQAYLTPLGALPDQACLAIAGPTHNDRIALTNNAWAFSIRALKKTFRLSKLKVINDFTAQALGVSRLSHQTMVKIGPGQTVERCLKLVMGPGTGLGMAGYYPGRHGTVILPSEGGHVSFAPTDDLEQALLGFLRTRYPRVSIERILCGQGLVDLYHGYCHLHRVAALHTTPADIHQAAETGDTLAGQSVERFLKILGDVSGDAALTLGARGGVYLCGGILPQLQKWLPGSRFREAFADKGRMSAYNAAIPTWLVTYPWVGLLGALEALHNEEIV